MSAVVRDEVRGVFATLAKCKRCGAPIYFGYSQTGRRAAFNVTNDCGFWIATRDQHDGEACLVEQALKTVDA